MCFYIAHSDDNEKHITYAIANGTNNYSVNIPEITQEEKDEILAEFAVSE